MRTFSLFTARFCLFCYRISFLIGNEALQALVSNLSALGWHKRTIQRGGVMAQNKIPYQAGLFLAQFTEQYGTESQCEAALEKAR